jgi:hypothetical protein
MYNLPVLYDDADVEEWKRIQQLDPVTYHLVKQGGEARIRQLKEQAARQAAFEKKKTEEWAQVGIQRLPQEEWEKKVNSPEFRREQEEELRQRESLPRLGEPFWTRERSNEVRADRGLPPFTEEEWKENERKWAELERRARLGQMTFLGVIGEIMKGLLHRDATALTTEDKSPTDKK